MYSALPQCDWEPCGSCTKASSSASAVMPTDANGLMQPEMALLLSHGHEPDRHMLKAFKAGPSHWLSEEEGDMWSDQCPQELVESAKLGRGKLTRFLLTRMGQFGIRESGHLAQTLDTVNEMLHTHPLELVIQLGSFLVCWISGAVELQLVDTSFFRALGLLLAVMLSLRAKNALTRREILMRGVLRLMNASRNIMGLLGSVERSKRKRLLHFLHFCYNEIAQYVDKVCQVSPRDRMNGLEDLDPADRDAAFIFRGKTSLIPSPRPLLQHIRQVVDECVDMNYQFQLANAKSFADFQSYIADPPDEVPEGLLYGPTDVRFVDRVSIIRRYHRNIDNETLHILQEFDALLMFREQLLTPHFRYMIHSIIFMYVILYPWCVQHESAIVLFLTSFGMGFVFYGLNHMTNGLEDPVKLKGQGFNLGLTFQQFFVNLDREDHFHGLARDYLLLKRKDAADCPATEGLHEDFVADLHRKQTDLEKRMTIARKRTVDAENALDAADDENAPSATGLLRRMATATGLAA